MLLKFLLTFNNTNERVSAVNAASAKSIRISTLSSHKWFLLFLLYSSMRIFKKMLLVLTVILWYMMKKKHILRFVCFLQKLSCIQTFFFYYVVRTKQCK